MPGSRTPHGHQPYLVERDGEVWSVATNGRVLVFLAGKAADFEPAPPVVAAQLLHFIDPVGRSTSFYLHELKEYLGAPVWPVQCPQCHGQGTGAAGACSQCKGDGGFPPEPRPGWVFSVLLDRNLLARALEPLQAEIVWVHGQDCRKPFWVVADAWRVVQVPLSAPNGHDPNSWEADSYPRLGG
ncbi:MAG TPA: hypothetical protein VEL76_35605 [Gemmataceae bacterium]|nr:hypothetical protein [Gemmataceae bacterium]